MCVILQPIPIIEVFNRRAYLSWLVFDEDHPFPPHTERSSAGAFGVTKEMLQRSVRNEGGALRRSGYYRASKEIVDQIEQECIRRVIKLMRERKNDDR